MSTRHLAPVETRVDKGPQDTTVDAAEDALTFPRKPLDTTPTGPGDTTPHATSTPPASAERGEEVSALRRSGRIRHPPNRLDL